MATIKRFFEGADGLIAEVVKILAACGLERRCTLDHICYKCGSTEDYEGTKALFKGAEIYEKSLSGRRVATIELPEPLLTCFGPIKWLELSDQKPDGSQLGRFEHIEVYSRVMSYESLVAQFRLKQADLKMHNVVHHPTWDVHLPGGYILRLTEGPLVHKIGRELLEKD
jgi:predicted metalloenzyme YecM